MKLCEECANKFPEHLVQPMCIQGQYVIVCPLCALIIRNATHGLPATTPFQGEQAKRDYDEACVFLGEQYLKGRDGNDSEDRGSRRGRRNDRNP